MLVLRLFLLVALVYASDVVRPGAPLTSDGSVVSVESNNSMSVIQGPHTALLNLLHGSGGVKQSLSPRDQHSIFHFGGLAINMLFGV